MRKEQIVMQLQFASPATKGTVHTHSAWHHLIMRAMNTEQPCECAMRQHLLGEVKLDMSGAALHGGQNLRRRGAGDGMNLLYLIHLIGAWEEWEQAHHLHKLRPRHE